MQTMRGCIVIGFLLGLAGAAVAQTAYPDKPIRMIVAFPPGGPTDLVARIMGPALAETLRQPVVFDNRPGAGGTVGAAILKRAAPDGYTMSTAANGKIALAKSKPGALNFGSGGVGATPHLTLELLQFMS